MMLAVVRRNQWLGVIVTVMVFGCAGAMEPAKPEVAVRDLGPAVEGQPGATRIRVKTLVNGLKEPWGMDFLPDGRLLVTEKSGALKLIDLDADQVRDIAGVPAVANAGQGGLMDVTVHPEFAVNQWVYFSYSIEENGLFSTRVSRGRLKGHELRQQEVLFTALPFFKERRHFGSRLLLGGGYLYITVGDRGNRDLAQSLSSHNGKVIRLTENGGIPANNPFTDQQNAVPGIWTLGHRSPQGLAKNRLTGEVWISEHGPQGGDEINRLQAGANYGWPVITYGEEYGGGKIGEGKHKEGMEQPLSHYSPRGNGFLFRRDSSGLGTLPDRRGIAADANSEARPGGGGRGQTDSLAGESWNAHSRRAGRAGWPGLRPGGWLSPDSPAIATVRVR